MGSGTAVGPDSEIYFVGGLDNEKSSNRIIKLDTQEMSYSFYAHLNTPRRKCRAIIQEGQLIVVGGYNNMLLAIDECEKIPMEDNAEERRVKKFPSLREKRWQHTCVVLNHGKVPWLQAVGGCDSRSNFLDTIERLNLSLIDSKECAWTTTSRKLPIPMSKVQICMKDNRHILLLGGCQQTEQSEKNNERTTAYSSQVHRQDWQADIIDVNWMDTGVKRDMQDKVHMQDDRMYLINDETGIRIFN